MAKVSQANVVFGRAVRSLREEQRLSQDELALRSGMHRTYIGRIERAESDIGLMTLRRLAAGLGLRGSELLAAAEQLEG